MLFSELPDNLKEEILLHLQNDNFPRAKAIYDTWLSKKAHEAFVASTLNSDNDQEVLF